MYTYITYIYIYIHILSYYTNITSTILTYNTQYYFTAISCNMILIWPWRGGGHSRFRAGGRPDTRWPYHYKYYATPYVSIIIVIQTINTLIPILGIIHINSSSKYDFPPYH